MGFAPPPPANYDRVRVKVSVRARVSVRVRVKVRVSLRVRLLGGLVAFCCRLWGG